MEAARLQVLLEQCSWAASSPMTSSTKSVQFQHCTYFLVVLKTAEKCKVCIGVTTTHKMTCAFVMREIEIIIKTTGSLTLLISVQVLNPGRRDKARNRLEVFLNCQSLQRRILHRCCCNISIDVYFTIVTIFTTCGVNITHPSHLASLKQMRVVLSVPEF